MIIMPLRLALAHRCSSQARQTPGTPQVFTGLLHIMQARHPGPGRRGEQPGGGDLCDLPGHVGRRFGRGTPTQQHEIFS
jgi:hypothetical protein